MLCQIGKPRGSYMDIWIGAIGALSVLERVPCYSVASMESDPGKDGKEMRSALKRAAE